MVTLDMLMHLIEGGQRRGKPAYQPSDNSEVVAIEGRKVSSISAKGVSLPSVEFRGRGIE